jgi:heptosyltransferase-2
MRDRVDIVGGWRRHSFDLAILFPDSFDAAMWAFAARIPERAGYVRDGRGFLLTRRARRTAATLTGHQVHYRLHLLEAALGIAGDPEDFVPDVDAGALAAIDAWLAKHRRAAGPLVALAPGAAYGPAKEWPAERWTALIDRLRAAHGVECVLIGSPGERRKCDEVAGASRGGAPIAAGETGIAEMIALLSRCAAFVGNDSGAMHVAGALGIPTVGIFGSTNPERTAPLGRHTHVVYRGIACSPCLQRTCRFGHYDCLRQIAVDEVTRLLAPYFEDRNA